MSEPIYVRSAEMFQDIFTSLQHHGRADIVLEPVEKKLKVCMDCGAELLEDEIELERCSLCHEISEDPHPNPEDVHGREELI